MESTGKVEIYSRNKKSPVEEKDKKRLKEGAGGCSTAAEEADTSILQRLVIRRYFAKCILEM